MHALLVLVLLPVVALALAAGPPSFPEPWTGIVSLKGPDGNITTAQVWVGDGVQVVQDLSVAPYAPNAWEWSQCGVQSNSTTYNPWTQSCNVECYKGLEVPCNGTHGPNPAGCACTTVDVFRYLTAARLQPGGCQYGYTGDLWVSTVVKGFSYCIVDNTAPVYVYYIGLNATWFFQEFQWGIQLPADWLQFPFACNCSPNAPKPRKSLLGLLSRFVNAV